MFGEGSERPADLRELALSLSERARVPAEWAEGRGSRHRKVLIGVGVTGVVAGGVAGITALADSTPLITGIAGFLAGTAAAVSSTLDAKNNAAFQFAQGAEYQAIAQRFEALAIAPTEPTREQLDQLIERWARCGARSPGGPTAGGAPST
jgi:hypothetical protein